MSELDPPSVYDEFPGFAVKVEVGRRLDKLCASAGVDQVSGPCRRLVPKTAHSTPSLLWLVAEFKTSNGRAACTQTSR